MYRTVLTILAAAALAAAAPVASTARQASGSGHHKRIVRHAVHPRSDITNFSSSSVLHVGVNHPPKNR
jgi:hypothetical protein